MPTDNPTNPIRNCNPKIHLTPNKNKYQNKILKPSMNNKQNHTGPN